MSLPPIFKCLILCLTGALIYMLISMQMNGNVSLNSFFAKKPPVIMAWTNFFSVNLTEHIIKSLENCPASCDVISHNKTSRILGNADAIIFHGRDSFETPPVRFPHQLYIYFMKESPAHAGEMIDKVPPDFFNMSMTYHPATDLNYADPYGSFRPVDPVEVAEVEKKIDMAMSRKTLGSLMFVSNCKTNSKREKYVKELIKHTEVSLYGNCFQNSHHCPRFNGTCETELLESHMFYLAFENSVCQDYVTEKFFKAQHFIVPVVLKRKVLRNIVPDHMFIAADDYDSPQQLADYLTYLRKDRAAYRNYFSWKKYLEIVPKPSGFCELCKDLNKWPQKTGRIENIRTFFMNEQCEFNFALKLLNN